MWTVQCNHHIAKQTASHLKVFYVVCCLLLICIIEIQWKNVRLNMTVKGAHLYIFLMCLYSNIKVFLYYKYLYNHIACKLRTATMDRVTMGLCFIIYRGNRMIDCLCNLNFSAVSGLTNDRANYCNFGGIYFVQFW